MREDRPAPPDQAVTRRIREAAARALKEAEARRNAKPKPDPPQREIGGADGPEPTRFGDWEHKGRASDF